MSFWLGKLAVPLRELPYKSVGGCSGWGDRRKELIGRAAGFLATEERVVNATVIQQRRAAQKQDNYYFSERFEMISNPELV